MNPEGFVLVIGAAGLDVKGDSAAELVPATSNPGYVRFGFGGVARNIAENLARLDVSVKFLTALGTDWVAENILQHSQAVGIDMSHVRRCPDLPSGVYMGVMDQGGDLSVAVCDYTIMNCVDAAYLSQHEALFNEARMLVLDLNISDEVLAYVFQLAETYDVPVVVDPTSPAKAGRLCKYLDKVYLVAPNAAETTSLCGLVIPAHDRDSAVQAAHHLITMGVKIAIVTLGEQGLAYATVGEKGHIASVKTDVVDTTGAGDALTAGVIFGLVNGIPLDEAMRLGVTAASLTLRSAESVYPGLNPDLLYEARVV